MTEIYWNLSVIFKENDTMTFYKHYSYNLKRPSPPPSAMLLSKLGIKSRRGAFRTQSDNDDRAFFAIVKGF